MCRHQKWIWEGRGESSGVGLMTTGKSRKRKIFWITAIRERKGSGAYEEVKLAVARVDLLDGQRSACCSPKCLSRGRRKPSEWRVLVRRRRRNLKHGNESFNSAEGSWKGVWVSKTVGMENGDATPQCGLDGLLLWRMMV
jgi:hypothetical protein